jgi:hypothetical protein
MTKKGRGKGKDLTCIVETDADGEYHALSKKHWREHRKLTGEEIGEPFQVPDDEDRLITIRFPKGTEGAELRIFVQKKKKIIKEEEVEATEDIGIQGEAQ